MLHLQAVNNMYRLYQAVLLYRFQNSGQYILYVAISQFNVCKPSNTTCCQIRALVLKAPCAQHVTHVDPPACKSDYELLLALSEMLSNHSDPT
jgi:hypothetical protein